MSIALALFAATSWGISDYAAGTATRRASGLAVTVAAHLTGLVLLLALAVAAGGTADRVSWTWGALAGACGGVGAAALYRGLAVGRMGVVAPVTAALGAALPAVAGIAFGDRPGPVVLAGVAIALPAVVLLALPGPGAQVIRGLLVPGMLVPRVFVVGPPARGPFATLRNGLPGLREALAAGVGFGGFFLCLEQAPTSAGQWPLVAARVASAGLLVLCALLLRRSPLPGRDALGGAVLAGALDAVAAALFLLALAGAHLTVAAVLVSLYPVATVALARVRDGEQTHRLQAVGLVVALASVVLIAAG